MSQQLKNEIKNIIRANAGAVWLQTNEELRARRILQEVGAELRPDLKCKVWSAARGLGTYEIPDTQDPDGPAPAPQWIWDQEKRDPFNALEFIAEDEERAIYIFQDLTDWLAISEGGIRPPEALTLERLLRETIDSLPQSQTPKAVAFIDKRPAIDMPGILSVDLPLPDKDQLAGIIDELLGLFPEEAQKDFLENGNRDAIVQSLSGLEAEAASASVCRSVAKSKRIDPALLLESKKALIRGQVQWIEPEPAWMLGGLANLQEWLTKTKRRFSSAAEKYQIPKPKGGAACGYPGTGKSLTAKILASLWGMPVLRQLPFESKYVGESQENLVAIYRMARAVAPCILWYDEAEKTFAGSGSDSSGVTQKILGIVLTEMQEDVSGIFHWFTMNDPRGVPSALFRRCEKLFWFNVPTQEECKEIAQVMQQRFKRTKGADPSRIAQEAARRRMTGAEIEKSFVEGMTLAFSDGERETTTEDIIKGMEEVTPVASSYERDLDAIKEAFKGSTDASKRDVPTTKTTTREGERRLNL